MIKPSKDITYVVHTMEGKSWNFWKLYHDDAWRNVPWIKLYSIHINSFYRNTLKYLDFNIKENK
jgi:hypothetical protein